MYLHHIEMHINQVLIIDKFNNSIYIYIKFIKLSKLTDINIVRLDEEDVQNLKTTIYRGPRRVQKLNHTMLNDDFVQSFPP